MPINPGTNFLSDTEPFSASDFDIMSEVPGESGEWTRKHWVEHRKLVEAVLENQSSRLNAPVDPAKYGIAADGSTNDTAAWQRLLAAIGDDEVAIQGHRGVSVITDRLILPTNVSFIGHGPNQTVFDANGANAGIAIANFDAATTGSVPNGGTYSGFKITGDANVAYSLWVGYCTNIEIANVWAFNSGGVGFFFAGTQDSRVLTCKSNFHDEAMVLDYGVGNLHVVSTYLGASDTCQLRIASHDTAASGAVKVSGSSRNWFMGLTTDAATEGMEASVIIESGRGNLFAGCKFNDVGQTSERPLVKVIAPANDAAAQTNTQFVAGCTFRTTSAFAAYGYLLDHATSGAGERIRFDGTQTTENLEAEPVYRSSVALAPRRKPAAIDGDTGALLENLDSRSFSLPGSMPIAGSGTQALAANTDYWIYFGVDSAIEVLEVMSSVSSASAGTLYRAIIACEDDGTPKASAVVWQDTVDVGSTGTKSNASGLPILGPGLYAITLNASSTPTMYRMLMTNRYATNFLTAGTSAMVAFLTNARTAGAYADPVTVPTSETTGPGLAVMAGLRWRPTT